MCCLCKRGFVRGMHRDLRQALVVKTQGWSMPETVSGVASLVPKRWRDAQRVRTRCRVFDSMELGVEHCEDRFLEVALQYALFRPRQQV